jgi:hypothetical protein
MDISKAIDIHPSDFYELYHALGPEKNYSMVVDMVQGEEYFDLNGTVYHRTFTVPAKTKNIQIGGRSCKSFM